MKNTEVTINYCIFAFQYAQVQMHLPTRTDRLKAVKHILSWVIWSVVALYTLFIVLTNLPPFQDWLGQRVAHAISGKLGTSAHVGTIQLGFPNRIIIDDVDILDQQLHPMVRIGRLSTKLQWLPLAEGRIVISSAQLFGARVSIYKTDSLAPANIQFAIDALASSDTTSQSPIDLRINSLIVRHSSISYDQKDIPTSDRLCLKHLRLTDISSHILLKALTDDSLSLNVKRLTLKEQCGISVNHLAFSLQAGRSGAMLRDLTLRLPHSMLSVDTLTAHYQYERMKETLGYRLQELKADVKLSDLKGLLPSLGRHADVVSLATTAEGTLRRVNVPRLEISTTGRDLGLSAKGWAVGIDRQYPLWHAEIGRLSLSEGVISSLVSEIEGLPKELANIGSLQLKGSFDGNEEGFIKTAGIINSGVGELSMDFGTSAEKHFTGKIDTRSIDLGRLLANDHLGTLATTIRLKGSPSAIAGEGEVQTISYNGYNYQNIYLDAHYSNDRIGGKIHIDDPHLQTDAEGEWQQRGKLMSMRIRGNIGNISPGALKLSDQWGGASFSSTIDADIQASSMNDAEGTIALTDFMMNDSTGTFRIDNVSLRTGFVNDRHFLKVSGDMGEARLTGTFDLATLPKSVASCFSSRIPNIPGIGSTTAKLDNDFDIDVYITSTEWLKRIFSIPLTLDNPIRLAGRISDKTHAITLNGNLPAFTYNDGRYSNANLHLTTIGDSIVCMGNVVKYMDNNIKMDLELQAGANSQVINAGLFWDNHTEGTKAMKGKLYTSTLLYTNEQGKPEAQLHTTSSHLTLGDAQWDIHPSDIIYSADRILVDHFSIEHDNQHLIIDGIASKEEKDTLIVDMKGLDISYVLDLLNFHPVDFAGFVTGRAQAAHLFDDEPVASADIVVSDFHFEHGRMGTLHAKAEWNSDDKQIDIHALADEGPKGRTHIDGFVSPVRSDIGLNIRGEGTNIEFLKTYTGSFLKDISGQAYGTVQLVGPLGDMDLLGKLVVDGQATVIPLGTTYTLRKDTVVFVSNDILLSRAAVHDINDDVAYLTGGIHHDHLSNVTFDLDVETDRLLAYDFKELGNELFCGTVVARGKVDMHGRPGEIIFNCDATPLKPTVFTYNAASTDAVSQQDFITWRNKHQSTEEQQQRTDLDGQKPQDIPTDIYINFLINANPDATVRLLMDTNTGDYITLYGSGVLRASYHNKGAFQMFGTYTVDRGTYGITIQNIIKKNFVFQEGGTIVFGGNPMDAALQLQAIYTVNGVSLSDLNIGNSFTNNTVRVNCLMNITGQAGSPRVDFDLDMPNVNSEEKQMVRSVIASEQEMNQQVLYLLGIGRFYTQGVNNAETQQYDQTQLAMQSFLSGTLSTQINELISQVFKNDDWNFGANISTGNEGWHNAEYEGLVSGRMLNNRLLINGQFGYRDNATQATPSFIGDFDIRYLLLPNGNLALKMYNQTNDRYFTRSSLNTQGLGLIIKKDFDGVGEIFQRRKKH